MVHEFEWSNTGLMLIYLIIAIAIPAVVMFFDDTTWEHKHPGHQ